MYTTFVDEPPRTSPSRVKRTSCLTVHLSARDQQTQGVVFLSVS